MTEDEDRETLAAKRMATLPKLIYTTEGMDIPASLIFVPGRRLNNWKITDSKAFGWAPTTWMTQQVYNYRFPSPIPQCRRSEALRKWYKVKIDAPKEDWKTFEADTIRTADEPSIIMSEHNSKGRWTIGTLAKKIGPLGDDTRWVTILGRAWIRLETNLTIIKERRDELRQQTERMAIGERLGPDQKWCIDGQSGSKKRSFDDFSNS
ncbi:uncharacterized protein A1O5_10414 [Cladophialophora psammophila CBS 110553]|uniref:Uncharacterized protein n=1 Tax=Cladophialophora psammophila CBS 110553 TaxID=1182543 RepID=W9WDS7_9EURO|nr:uncharacterized protein A1O5_10414 [Cladophialophora psammophila CBS 110553]EXJ66262.1 hypothetical protein A1O5_10414 [Cladophialophora psammophila CBS 110553]